MFQPGKKLYDEGEHKEAIIRLFEALNVAKTNEETAEAVLYIALCYYALGERENCANYLRKLFEAKFDKEIEALLFPSGFVGLFVQIKNEASKKAPLKPDFKAEERKAEEKKAEPEKKVEPENKLESGKKPEAIAGKAAAGTQVKKKGKFPWLLVGGIVVAGGVVAVWLLSKKKSSSTLPPSPPPATTGSISITSSPAGAKVYLDGNDTGQITNCTLTDIATGSHTLKCILENFGQWEGSVNVVGGQTANVSVSLIGYAYEFVAKWGSYGSGDGQFNLPDMLAVDSSGNLYVADSKNNRVQKFSSNGAFLAKWGSEGPGDGQFNGDVRGIAVDNLGHIYVSCIGIQKFDSHGAFLAKWGAYPDLFNPYGVAADNAGYVYVATQGFHRIDKFKSDGTFIARWGSYGAGDGQFNEPYGIAADGFGYVYVTDYNNHRVQKFNAAGNFIVKWGGNGTSSGQFAYPQGIAVDKLGYVYVVDKNNSRVQKFTSSGAFVTTWGTAGTGDGQMTMPRGIAVDSAGYVYVADAWNHRIQKFRMGAGASPSAAISYAPLGKKRIVPDLPSFRKSSILRQEE